LLLGFFFVGVAEAMSLGLAPESALPWVRVVATEVDHIQPLSRGGGHEWENLQALCKSCHSKKTARETGFTRG
jgi:hypothetical protein